MLDYSDKDVKKARASWNKKNPKNPPCREDIWMEILRTGGTLVFEDEENDGEYTRKIVLSDVHSKMGLTPIEHLSAMINEQDDAETGDIIIQSVLYDGVIIFG
jgi:hypothetical protein